MKCQVEWSTAGIKIAGKNINNLRYADDTTLMAESEEESKSLKVKEGDDEGDEGDEGEREGEDEGEREEWKGWLKTQHP